jgi:CheY-like chemotaxis protein
MSNASQIYSELGDRAVLSYIKSSYHLLCKVYHPDMNPQKTRMATITQQRLNTFYNIITMMKDEEIISIFHEPATNANDNQKARKIRILIVEDEFGLQEIFKEIFFMEGYNVRAAIDGIQGLKEYNKFVPDLIFTDVVMPNMSGLELVSRIREVDPSIKVIYVSGFFGIKRLKHELDKEIATYGYPTLAKPFKTSEMLELVKQYLPEPISHY